MRKSFGNSIFFSVYCFDEFNLYSSLKGTNLSWGIRTETIRFIVDVDIWTHWRRQKQILIWKRRLKLYYKFCSAVYIDFFKILFFQRSRLLHAGQFVKYKLIIYSLFFSVSQFLYLYISKFILSLSIAI